MQNSVKHNLWEKLDECTQSNDTDEHLGHQVLDSEQCYLRDNYSENRSMIEEYTMDTSLENCLLNEKLLESLQSIDGLEEDKDKMVIDHSENDPGKCSTKTLNERYQQFNSPVKSESHRNQSLVSSTSLEFKSLKTPPSKIVMNTSVDSLVDATGLDSLLDGVEWSPMISCPENHQITRYMNDS